MSLMTILILLGVVSLVLGPIMMMQPSPAQRRMASLREAALKNGLRVHMQPVPTSVKLDYYLDMAAMYCLPWTEQKHTRSSWLLTQRSYTHELHFDGVWEWQGEERELNVKALKCALAKVPNKVFAVARGPQGLCCYWSEFGKEEDVQALARWLKEDLLQIVESSS